MIIRPHPDAASSRCARRVAAGALGFVVLAYCAFMVLLFFTFHSPLDQRWQVDTAVSEAIGDGRRGDYARAVAIIRAAELPADDKELQVGYLIVEAFNYPDARHPDEPLAEGVRLIERAALGGGAVGVNAREHLRLLFRDGSGRPADAIPIDRPVSDCWAALQADRSADPAPCVALRRQRLPGLSP